MLARHVNGGRGDATRVFLDVLLASGKYLELTPALSNFN
jgi:hypothetical protein